MKIEIQLNKELEIIILFEIMNLDNYIKHLINLRDKNDCGNFQVRKWEIFEKDTCFEGILTSLTKSDIELYKDKGFIVIKDCFHPKSN